MQCGFCPHLIHSKVWHHSSRFHLVFRLILPLERFLETAPDFLLCLASSPHSPALLYPALLSRGVYSDMCENVHNSCICKTKIFISSMMDKQIMAICDKMEHSTAIKMNKLLLHVASWMNLTNTMQATKTGC